MPKPPILGGSSRLFSGVYVKGVFNVEAPDDFFSDTSELLVSGVRRNR